jgi:hypothetical protein
VLIRLWVVARSIWVALRFWSATMAPTFVFTLFIGMNRTPSFKASGGHFDAGGILPGQGAAIAGPAVNRRNPSSNQLNLLTLPDRATKARGGEIVTNRQKLPARRQALPGNYFRGAPATAP